MADLTGGIGRRREELLPPVLRAEQRDARRSSATSTRRRRRRWVAKYFGDICRAASRSRGRRSAAGAHGARSGSRSRIACRCRGLRSRGRRSATHSADQPALDLLGDILGGSRTARLRRRSSTTSRSRRERRASTRTERRRGDVRLMRHAAAGAHADASSRRASTRSSTRFKRDGPTPTSSSA